MSNDLPGIHIFLSQPQFACLNFHDVSILTDTQVETITRCLNEILKYFIKSISHHQPPTPSPSPFFQNALEAWINAKLSSVWEIEKRAFLTETCVEFMEHFYPLATDEMKLLTGCITAAAIVVDDCMASPSIREEIREFTYRYLRGLEQPEGVCVVLEEILRESDTFLGGPTRDKQMANTAIISVLNFVDSTFLEAEFVDDGPVQISGITPNEKNEEKRKEKGVPWCASKFPYHLRQFTGMPAFYAVMLFTPSSKPGTQISSKYWIVAAEELNHWICVVNDLFSLPKELRGRETTNNIPLQVRVRWRAGWGSSSGGKEDEKGEGEGWSFRDTLEEILKELISDTKAIDELLITCPSIIEINFQHRLLESKEAEKDECQGENGMVNGRGGDRVRVLEKEKKEVEMANEAKKLWGAFRRGYVGSYVALRRYALDNLREELRRCEG